MSTQVSDGIYPTPPSAFVTLKKGEYGYFWVIKHCPHCGKRHTHGGGPLDGDPRTRLGHRVAHCGDWQLGDGGYVLVEQDGGVK